MESRKETIMLVGKLFISNSQKQTRKMLDASNAKHSMAKISDIVKLSFPDNIRARSDEKIVLNTVIEIRSSNLNKLGTTNGTLDLLFSRTNS